jgi:DNA-binding NtrC family response regulator
MKGKILVIDDEELIRTSTQQYLEKEGYRVFTAGTGREGLEVFKAEENIDLVLLDLRLPDASGMEILKTLRQMDSEVYIVVITAYGDVETVVSSMKLGAYDFVEKPFELDKIAIIIRKAMEAHDLKKEATFLREEKHEKYNFNNIVGTSKATKEMIKLAKRLAENDVNIIFIQGESGTGKTMIARTIHYQSPRASKPFVEVTCTALPETLIESELFGHEKGAFTDAKATKKGLFELADGGTIYLDEIGDITPQTQAKLLRVIEEKSFMRIGGVKEKHVDVRIIATTNRDIEKDVKEGRFRSDLYYRLNLVPFKIPPLRERREDIIPIAMHFIGKLRIEYRKDIIALSKEAEELLVDYDWPGNVRELRNVIERVFILTNERIIRPEHIILKSGTEGRDKAKGFELYLPEDGIPLEEVEKNLIQQALKRTNNNQTKAAQLLGLTRDAFRYRMQKFGLL